MNKSIKNFGLLSLVLLNLTACSAMQEAKSPTAEGLKSKTAGVLGNTPNEVTITNIRSDGSNTYYLAKTAKATYSCTVMSGSMFAISTAGYSIAPQCTKK